MTDTAERRARGVTTGEGVAIAGLWLGASAASIVFALIAFVWAPDADAHLRLSEDAVLVAFILTLLLIAAPMMAAFEVTTRILDRS